MIAFVSCQAKEPLLQNRVAAIPERQRETDVLVPIADASQTILSPSIRFRPRMVVGEVVPRRAVRAVILTHRPPCTLAQIGAPALPVPLAFARFVKPSLLRGHVSLSL